MLKAVKRTQRPTGGHKAAAPASSAPFPTLSARGAAIVVVMISLVITTAIVLIIHLLRINGILPQVQMQQPDPPETASVSVGPLRPRDDLVQSPTHQGGRVLVVAFDGRLRPVVADVEDVVEVAAV